MGSKNSTCLYLDREVVATAKRMGLNVSKVSENALKEAIDRLKGPKPETRLDSSPPSKGRGMHALQLNVFEFEYNWS